MAPSDSQRRKAKRLVAAAARSPNNFRFNDLVALAIGAGFGVKEAKGDHKKLWHPDLREILAIDPHPKKKQQAKPYQVRLLVELIEDHDLLGDIDDNEEDAEEGEEEREGE